MERLRFEWQKEHTARLINLLKKNELLWDNQNPKYHHKDSREEAYFSILYDLKDVLPDDANIDDLRSKYNCIRTQHTRAIRAKKSGADVRSKLWCYDMLHFLRGEPEPASIETDKGNKDPLKSYWKESDDGHIKWSRDQLMRLISQFREHRCLWDRTDKSYKNYRDCMVAFKDIIAALKIPQQNRADVTHKLRLLRTQYSRELWKQEKRISKGETDYEPSWYCFKALNFLRSSIMRRNTTPTIQMASDDFKKIDDSTLENSIEYNDDFDEGNECNEYNEEFINEASSISSMPIKRRKISDNLQREERSNMDCARFNWLGDKILQTLNSLHNEDTIYEFVNGVCKLINAAECSDSVTIQPKDLLHMFKDHKECVDASDDDEEEASSSKSTFDITLTFDAQSSNFTILDAIRKLPNLKSVQFTGNNFETALKQKRRRI